MDVSICGTLLKTVLIQYHFNMSSSQNIKCTILNWTMLVVYYFIWEFQDFVYILDIFFCNNNNNYYYTTNNVTITSNNNDNLTIIITGIVLLYQLKCHKPRSWSCSKVQWRPCFSRNRFSCFSQLRFPTVLSGFQPEIYKWGGLSISLSSSHTKEFV